MKYLISTLFLLFLLLEEVPAQIDSLDFYFPIYFEDAIGNRDTIYIGGAEDASREINPQYGEINLAGVPFDSVFEVRAGIYSEMLSVNDPMSYRGKSRIIQIRYTNPGGSCDGIGFSDNAAFIVHSLHPPVTISWDHELWKPGGMMDCVGGSFFFNTFTPDVIDNLEEALAMEGYDAYCMADAQAFASYFPFIYNDMWVDWSFLIGDHTTGPVQGSANPVDTMFVYSLWWASTVVGSPCHYTTDTETVRSPAPSNLLVYPNPVGDQLNVSLDGEDSSIISMDVFDAIGRRVQSISGENLVNISTKFLRPGVYVLVITGSKGDKRSAKFIK